MERSWERCTVVVEQRRSAPPRAREILAVLSPAVMAPLLPITALPLATEREPDTVTPSVGTYAMGLTGGGVCCAAAASAVRAQGSEKTAWNRRTVTSPESSARAVCRRSSVHFRGGTERPLSDIRGAAGP